MWASLADDQDFEFYSMRTAPPTGIAGPFPHVRLGSLLSAATDVVADLVRSRPGQADRSGELVPLFGRCSAYRISILSFFDNIEKR